MLEVSCLCFDKRSHCLIWEFLKASSLGFPSRYCGKSIFLAESEWNTPDRDTKLSPAMCVFDHPIRDCIPIPLDFYFHYCVVLLLLCSIVTQLFLFLNVPTNLCVLWSKSHVQYFNIDLAFLIKIYFIMIMQRVHYSTYFEWMRIRKWRYSSLWCPPFMSSVSLLFSLHQRCLS